MKYCFTTVLLILALVFAAQADAPNGLAFLKISTDVRSAALGETGVVSGNPSAASFFNPALAALSKRPFASFSHHRWIQDTQLNFLHFQYPAFLNIGVSILSTGVEGIEVRPVPSPQPVDMIDSRDLMFSLNLARSLSPYFHLGLGVKYIHEHIFYKDTEGFALDLGMLYQMVPRLTLGASLVNIGKMSPMLDERPQLPLTARIGAAYSLPLDNAGEVMFAVSGIYIKEEEWRGNLGCEYQPFELIALRGGYLFNYDERDFTAGIGVKWENFDFDFAYVPFKSDLGSTQRFGLTIEF